MRYIGTIIIAVAALLGALSAGAVTDKEMDQARAITAKAYLRYVNDGSGYLDEISVKSMSELTPKLKAKEKENLKVFNSVKVPSDYASWDKAKLLEFWGSTFFTSPALDSKGKGARTRVRRQISEMSVAAPAPKAEETKAEPAKQETPVAEAAADAGADAVDAAMPTAETAVDAQQDILSDQKAIEAAEAESAPATPEEQSHTWVYVLVLAILVAVVIWLVVYAANLMKRQPGADEAAAADTDANLREQTRTAIAKKNQEVEQIRKRLQDEESRSAELGIELERLKLENSRLNEQIARLREERINEAHAPAAPAPVAPAPAPKAVEPAPRNVEPARQQAAPVQRDEKPVIKVIYLGRANRRGIFVRADRRINPGNTIYRLDTNDGLVGTFHVVDEPEVVDVALSNPTDYLEAGCMGEDLQDIAGVTRIVTVSAGTAIFENGYWKVLRKTRIRYE